MTEKMQNKMMSAELKEKFNQLNSKEKKYFSIMWAKYGVLFLKSRPGVAKSAIGKSIAEKMGFFYKDIRLSMIDETDVGLFPIVSDVETEEGKGIKCLDFAIPRWAIEANTRPTVIHFEELNRASLQVRNAALQILLERQIGEFKFNDNVLMLSSGNLGDEDGTDVEELDNALKNRLIHVNHTLSVDEWISDFATQNVHPSVMSFIKTHPEYMYKDPVQNVDAYATPRSWTMLSEYIISNFGIKSEPRDFIPSLQEIAHSYVGNSAMRFLQYCEESMSLSIEDILNDFDGVSEKLNKYNRDKKSELLTNLNEYAIEEMTEAQVDNVYKFLCTVSDDEKTGYIVGILDNADVDVDNPKVFDLLTRFKDIVIKIDQNCQSNDNVVS